LQRSEEETLKILYFSIIAVVDGFEWVVEETKNMKERNMYE